MNKQLIIIGIVIVILVIGLSGCNEISNTLDPEKKRFVGEWRCISPEVYVGLRLNFFSDGTYDGAGGFGDGTYEIKDGKLVLIWQYDTGGTNTDVYSYSFSDNDNTLKFSGWMFAKQ